jgi:cytochrome c-type biogenesis protein CcmH/NrfG
MGVVIAAGIALVICALLWRFGKLPRVAAEPVLAALVLGLAGYVAQGSPSLPGHPVKARAASPKIDEEALAKAREMGPRFGNDVAWLVASEGMMRAGATEAGVGFVKRGLRDYPNSPDLWVGLGNALVAHAEGQASPAAIYAYKRAAQIAPESPTPPFFLGLALAQSGQLDEARSIWAELLARAPKDAPWRADVEERLAVLDMLIKSR